MLHADLVPTIADEARKRGLRLSGVPEGVGAVHLQDQREDAGVPVLDEDGFRILLDEGPDAARKVAQVGD